jgi:hypothetical protein
VSAPGAPAARRLRCALFVDFDNVYIGLRRLDPAAADAFAAHPGRWLSALENGTDADGDFSRRFLVRACYLNPTPFSEHRASFTRAGFSVVDCPSLTQQGKSSADINLVLDAVDALAATAHYDEFVIVSADADFTPLALRCRAADRRVTIVTAGPAAAAYRAVADTVIPADELVELVREPAANEPDPAAPPVPPPSAPPAPPTSAAGGAASSSAPPDAPPSAETARRAVVRAVRAAGRPLNGGMAAQAALAADPTLTSTGWSGRGTFFDWLAAEVPELRASPKPSPGYVFDPARFSEADLPGATPVHLPPLQRQVVEVTDIPNLPTDLYGALLRALAGDLAKKPFDRVETARRVHDACQKGGQAIGRASVNAVIAGLLYAELDLGARPPAPTLAGAWADHVIGLCRGARVALTAESEAAVRTWVGGGLAPAPGTTGR